jgi:hypothetical protein
MSHGRAASTPQSEELLALERCIGFVILYTTFGAHGLREHGYAERTMKARRAEFRRLFGMNPGDPGALLAVQSQAFHRITGSQLEGADLLDAQAEADALASDVLAGPEGPADWLPGESQADYYARKGGAS